MTGELSQWVIYDHPADFPDSYVARRWTIGPRGIGRTDDIRIGTLEQLREPLQEAGLFMLTRSPEDDPTIVEVWT